MRRKRKTKKHSRLQQDESWRRENLTMMRQARATRQMKKQATMSERAAMLRKQPLISVAFSREIAPRMGSECFVSE
jgi:hypothetical protein